MSSQHSKQSRAPLFEAMVAHHEKNPASFHVPGHKSGQGLLDEGDKFPKDGDVYRLYGNYGSR